MEQKLAEFRARRQAGNPLKRAPCEAPPPKADPRTDTLATDGQVKEERPLNKQASPSTPQYEDRSNWLLNSALGRWLASRNVVSSISILKVLLWLVLLGLFVEIEFGLPFFVISLFYWMYEGLRTPAGREPGELSAYSVFNPDCQALLGSLTAEQLEGEMGYRPLANR